MRKNYFAKALILGAAMLLALACTKEGNQKKVAVLLPDASSLDRWATDKSNLETVMASYGFNTTFYIAPETEAGAAQQVEQLREAINAGAKCVVLTAIDYKKACGDDLREYFAKVLPNYDRDRVHTSDIKKLIQWYNILIENGITDFKEEMKPTEGDNVDDRKDAE